MQPEKVSFFSGIYVLFMSIFCILAHKKQIKNGSLDANEMG